MPREIVLLRHGKSDWSLHCEDFDRPLKKRGKRCAKEAGRWMKKNDLFPDRVVCSPAKRALSTAKRVMKAMGLSPDKIQSTENLYPGEPGKLLEMLQKTAPEAKRVLLVGHNPGLEELLELLCREKISAAPDGKVLPTATIARLSFDGEWSELEAGSADLVEIRRPG